MGTAALRESKVSHGDHDREKRFREDIVYIVDEKALHGARSFGEDRSSRIRILEILCYLIGVGKRFSTPGIVNNRESVNWSTISAVGSWGNIQLTKDIFDVGRFDPMSAVRETFVVENESTGEDHCIVLADEKKI